MRMKYTIFATLVIFLVLVINPDSKAVSLRKINEVRNKGVLDSGDFEIIDNFVAQAVRELVKTRDFTSIANARAVILSSASSSTESAAAQYAEQFFESANKYIAKALEQAEMLTPEDRKFKAILNLLILVDNLQDVRLADLAIGMLNNGNTAIRYWAVHSVTNPAIIEQLNSTNPANLTLASEIAGRLEELVDDASPEMIALMAQFAAEVKIPQGEDLLLKIADMRISKYADWTVDYELLDATILKLLYGKLSSAKVKKSLPATSRDGAAVARRFGQLYSYAMQRYIKDINGGDFLSVTEKRQLASVLVEVEKNCIGRLLRPQSTIRRAVEKGDVKSLLKEHSRLFGDETGPGKLALKLKFDYGETPNGNKRTAPLALPDRPKN